MRILVVLVVVLTTAVWYVPSIVLTIGQVTTQINEVTK